MTFVARTHWTTATIRQDLIAGLVVFLVALPLCLGIALASNAPIFSGVIAGIVGGLVVGAISRSQTSVSGPAAGLTAVVGAQIAGLGSFESFLLAVVLAGVIQVALGLAKAGFIAEFVPTSVIKGLLAAIGIILILKQIPYLFGAPTAPPIPLSFQHSVAHGAGPALQKILSAAQHYHIGTLLIGLFSIVFLVVWDRWTVLKKSFVPGPLVVVVLGIALAALFASLGGSLRLDPTAYVNVPVPQSTADLTKMIQLPDFRALAKPALYLAALVIALVASLETLLNIEAVDKIDPQQRVSPSSWELVAQGCGNIVSGLLGGLPVTSVIIRSSVNINSGGQTQLSAIFHGVLLLIAATLVPRWMNQIPLSCLAAILIMTGLKLASVSVLRQMWNLGPSQILPFVVTVIGIVQTDLLIGILVGLSVSLVFVLHQSWKQSMHTVQEQSADGPLVRVELPGHVTFLNLGSLKRCLEEFGVGEHVLIDGHRIQYLDPDVQGVLQEFVSEVAPRRSVRVSVSGFPPRYSLPDVSAVPNS